MTFVGSGILFRVPLCDFTEVNSDGLGMDKCGATDSPGRGSSWAVIRHQCLPGNEFIRFCVERTGFDGDEPRRTGKRLLVGEGAGNGPEGPEGPLWCIFETRPWGPSMPEDQSASLAWNGGDPRPQAPGMSLIYNQSLKIYTVK